MAWFGKEKNQNSDHYTGILEEKSFSKQTSESAEIGTKLQLVSQELKKADIKYQIKFQKSTDEVFGYIDMIFATNNLNNVRVRICSIHNNSELVIVSDYFAKFPLEKIHEGYKVVNSINQLYKYVRFVMEDNGGVFAQWNLPDNVPNDAVGKITAEILVKTVKIIDDAYPIVMRAIFS